MSSAYGAPVDPVDDMPSTIQEAPPLGYDDPGVVKGTLQTLPRLVSKQWIIATIFIVLGMAGLARLGVWQLDRLEQRRAFNRMVVERWTQPPYDLAAQGLPEDIKALEYRRVEADGTWDYEHQMVLTNQPGPNGEAGVRLMTPLRFADGRAVLVVRGWVPQEYATPDRWPEVQETAGAPAVGLIQTSQTIQGAPAPAGFQTEWYRADLPLIGQTLPYPLLPAFLLQLPEEGRSITQLPYRAEPISLDEGSHLSYAIQWFTFALILGFGYTQFVRLQESRRRRAAAEMVAEGGDVPPTPDELTDARGPYSETP